MIEYVTLLVGFVSGVVVGWVGSSLMWAWFIQKVTKKVEG